MYAPILWTVAVRLLPFAFAVTALNFTYPTTCTYRPCPTGSAPGMVPPSFELFKCGKGGYVRCGALLAGDGRLASQCSCPSPEICFSRLDHTFLSNTSKYWDVGRHPGDPMTGPPSGYCTGKPCDSSIPSGGTCRTTTGGQNCVRKVLRWDGDEPVGSSKAYCLENYDKMRCGGKLGEVSAAPCPKGWNCVQDMASPSGLGFCSPDSLEWA
jgi:hypothetical protein